MIPRIPIATGGDRAASRISNSCTGFISNAPDVRLNFEAGTLPLIGSFPPFAWVTELMWWC